MIVVVITGRRGDCSGSSSQRVSSVNGTGYLSSLITERTGVGAADCPWLLRAGSGQRISLSLLDFSVSSSGSQSTENEAALKPPPSSSQHCVRLALVREVSGAYRRGDREVCSMRAGGDMRERSVYLSEANELEVVIARPYGVDMSTTSGSSDAIFLLRYDGTSHCDVIAGAR